MNVLEPLKKISTFVFDVDGVLTDCTVLVLENGLQARRMHIKDGLGLQMALKNGFRVVVISGSNADPVIDRLTRLGLTDIYMGIENKRALLDDYCRQHQLQWDELLYMADDLPDLAAMQQVGIACCPADAVNEVKAISHYISPLPGGQGCVREVIEKVLKVQDKWLFDNTVVSR
ncbi:MAG TPA: 3-deoxy-D-manno-octulosonate 8-phosphate phosphatase [Chitinophagaceae bacterium]|nr:3-deoxy-D-manno-octulosonate 8-phosphate phosphatase [Chitinophagaceae bacterium]